MDEMSTRKYLSSFSEEKKLINLHNFFQGKMNAESMKFLTALVKVNKKGKKKDCFQSIIDLVEPEFFTTDLHSQSQHYRVDLENFEYLDFGHPNQEFSFVSPFI